MKEKDKDEIEGLIKVRTVNKLVGPEKTDEYERGEYLRNKDEYKKVKIDVYLRGFAGCICGQVLVKKGVRVSDYIEKNERSFIVLTNVHDYQKNLLRAVPESGVLIINKNDISLIVPLLK